METDTRPMITPIPLDPAASQRSLQSSAATYVPPPHGGSTWHRAIISTALSTAQHTGTDGAEAPCLVGEAKYGRRTEKGLRSEHN